MEIDIGARKNKLRFELRKFERKQLCNLLSENRNNEEA